ncbi:alpha/beta hydrolase [Levilactobacillus acidifarinae]|uniref:Cell surface hydrolase n=1 Tax=Levilactobacillus acidifarinae DSM 19394 = JCM 15949 TaxID=1423715 RepID=A0A0R1LUU5_9LACO|nr:hypothetical protein FD25_GL002495 [Levilactobacillus acidifarinae DSM 19394]GEO69691.1 alpha/beta hydrolase [Levilactobacillus acidifarinae]
MRNVKRQLGLLILSLVSLWGLWGTVPAHAATTLAAQQPTLFFHGSSSSYKAEVHMVGAIKKAGITNKKSVIRANVSSKGKVKLIGKLPATAKNPIVEVNYLNSNNHYYQTWGRWAKNVVVKLQKTYHFKKMNMVGHSMGNMAIMYYLIANAKNKKLPQLQKQVALGGHFDGVLGEDDYAHYIKLSKSGKPNHMDTAYRYMLRLRKLYPKSAKVLNVYGDLHNGTDSDGRVSNNSSRSMKYLVAGRAKSYRTKQLFGASAQHSRLHNNAHVDKLLISFLW